MAAYSPLILSGFSIIWKKPFDQRFLSKCIVVWFRVGRNIVRFLANQSIVRNPKKSQTLISSPFSWSDLSFGSGGTLATQGLVILPARKISQVAQSPLDGTPQRKRKKVRSRNILKTTVHTNSYFLQEYVGLTPSCCTALERGLPALKSFFFPL
jgi:hypothetical protein